MSVPSEAVVSKLDNPVWAKISLPGQNRTLRITKTHDVILYLVREKIFAILVNVRESVCHAVLVNGMMRAKQMFRDLLRR